MNKGQRRQFLLASGALLLASAMPVIASMHTSAECSEGGEFIRNAAISRDNGLPKDAFLNHLIADLSMIRTMPGDTLVREGRGGRITLDPARRTCL